MSRRSKAEREESRRKFDALLEGFAGDIRINEEFERRGDAAANQVFRLLQTQSEYSIDRVKIAGGKAKNTSISGHVDYDCVVFINGEEPPFDCVIEEFEALILDNFETDVKVTPYSLKFRLDDVNFDLLPATNEVRTHNTSDTIGEQVARALDKIKCVPRSQLRYHSAALTEGAVDFIQSRSDFVPPFIRLCKCWNLGVNYDGYISGRSTMIETIAVSVAEQEEARASYSQRGDPSLRNAFTSFLEYMRYPSAIRVAFFYNYTPLDVPEQVALQQPLVLDPSNPTNNLLHGLTESDLYPFEELATDSLKEIHDLNAEAYFRDLDYNDILTFFYGDGGAAEAGY